MREKLRKSPFMFISRIQMTKDVCQKPVSFDRWWPLLTSRPTFLKISSKALFWTIICLLMKKIRIWPFLGISDLGWPHLTLRLVFGKVKVKSVVSIYTLPYFIWVQKLSFFMIFDPGWRRMTSWLLFFKSWY